MSNATLTSRIPVEIWTEIFLTLENDLFKDSHSPNWGDLGHTLPPLELTQVCSSWRTMLLDFPPFWTKIILNSSPKESWLDELVHRSQGSPLDVKAIASTKTQFYDVDLVMKYIAQMRSLELNASFYAISGYFGRGFNKNPVQAPLLEEFCLRTIEYEDLPPIAAIPWRLEAPKLKRFDSYPCLPPHSLHTFTSLRELKLVNSASIQVFYTAQLFFQVLSTLHLLEKLVWIGRLDSADPNDLEGQTFHLPHLTSVTLGAGRDPLLGFLERVHPNPSCTFHLIVFTDWGTSLAFLRLSRAISARVKELKGGKELEATVDLKVSSEKGPLTFEIRTGPPQCALAGSEPDFRLSVECPNYIVNNPGVYAPFHLVMALRLAIQEVLINPDITKFNMSWEWESDKVVNKSSFALVLAGLGAESMMVNVTELTVNNLHPSFFDELLVSVDPPPLPSLTVIRITGRGIADVQGGKLQGAAIRDYINSRRMLSETSDVETLDIRSLDPGSILYSSLVNVAQSGGLGANLLTATREWRASGGA